MAKNDLPKLTERQEKEIAESAREALGSAGQDRFLTNLINELENPNLPKGSPANWVEPDDSN